ncbi:diguanylate cyclase [Deferribacter thermophilus]|uniref:GGDEF domain-containing response regulator n=1 Tax=Deferribacter thermophilus TaxID=53573 RepID=UPI003C1D03BF
MSEKLDNLKVLIVEDDKDYIELTTIYLQKWGYDYVVSTNGKSAIECLKNDKDIGLMLLDWMLPDTTGVEICEYVRNNILDRYVYIVMVTGKKEKKDVIEALKKGADDYISKPYDYEELNVRIHSGFRILKLERRLKESYQKLYEMATHDALTGILNRGAIEKKLKREVERGKRIGHEVGVILIDIDNFKRINDEYGHQIGDIVLQDVAEVLETNCRRYDYVGRYGGEEFLIVLPGLNSYSTSKVAERIRKEVENRSFHAVNIDLKVTISLGVCSTKEAQDIKDLIKKADEALYKAKREGKNRTVVYQGE